jgi:isopentenyl phosphate kinase
MKDKADSAGKAATDAAGGMKDKADSAGKAATDAAGGMKDKADSAGKAATDAAGGMKDKVAAVAGLTSLSGVVSNTTTAVNAGNFDKAKTEIAKFDGFWTKVKGDVGKSPTDSSAIETNIKNAKSAIASADKAKAIEALKALGTAITTATKS